MKAKRPNHKIAQTCREQQQRIITIQMPRPCKICVLKKKNAKAFKRLTDEINSPSSGLSMTKYLVKFNEEFKLDIIPMNVSRHKTHMDGNVTELKSKSPEPPPEMKVYSKEGDVIFSDIQKVIGRLDDKEKLFCEALVYKHGYNGTGARMEIYNTDNHNSAAVAACRMLKKQDVSIYVRYLINKKSRELMLTPSFVIEGLMENYFKCVQAVPVMGLDGPTGTYNFNAQGANQALKLLGEHLGMWDKRFGSENNAAFYDGLMEKMADNQISPVQALFELAKKDLPFQEVAKTLLAKADLSQITEGPQREGDDLKKASTTELEERLKAIKAKKEKICS